MGIFGLPLGIVVHASERKLIRGQVEFWSVVEVGSLSLPLLNCCLLSNTYLKVWVLIYCIDDLVTSSLVYVMCCTVVQYRVPSTLCTVSLLFWSYYVLKNVAAREWFDVHIGSPLNHALHLAARPPLALLKESRPPDSPT